MAPRARSDDLAVVLERLPRLSASDLVKVGEALRLAVSYGGKFNGNAEQHGVAGQWGEILLDCIVDVTHESVGYPIAKETLRGMTAYKSFRNKLPSIIKFIEHAAPEYYQRRAICKLGVELLFGYLHSPDRMAGPSTLMYQIHRLPAALDAQFPGYSGAGLLGFIITRRERIG